MNKRQKKKHIPYGDYCYQLIGVITTKEYCCMKTKICPFYSHLEGVEGYCSFAKSDVDDQCKVCNYRDIKSEWNESSYRIDDLVKKIEKRIKTIKKDKKK